MSTSEPRTGAGAKELANAPDAAGATTGIVAPGGGPSGGGTGNNTGSSTAIERSISRSLPAIGAARPMPPPMPGGGTPGPEKTHPPAVPPPDRTPGPSGTGRSHPAVGLHATVPTPSSPITVRLGRYQIVERIATGGMAEVYLAVHGELAGFRTPVVLKKVLPHLANNPQFIDMFLDEARIASMLDHPNVVRIYEVGRSGSEYFLAMELVQGKSLSALLRRFQETYSRMDPRLAAFVVAQAAAGLHHAHNLTDPLGNPLGLVHRDVSPQNILISFEGSVKVIDFGIARALGRITETQTGGMKGKFGYMSPEQARGEDVDLRTDIFALGVVLWEALTNRRLFQRENDLATMRALAYEPIPRPSTVCDVSPELESLVMRALARNSKLRFANGREMASALEKWVVQEGGTSASDLGALVKGLFVADHSSWQQTLRTAVNLPAITEQDLAGPPAPAVPITNSGVQSTPRRWPLFAMSAAALGAALASFVFARTAPPPVDQTPPPALSSPAAVKVLGPAPVGPVVSPVTTPPATDPADPTRTPTGEEVAAVPGTAAVDPHGDPSKIKATTKKQRRPKTNGKTGGPGDRRPNPF